MQNSAPINDLMSPEEAAHYLRISVLTLAKMRWGGTSELPYVKLSRKRILYRQADLDRWLAGCLVAPTNAGQADHPRDTGAATAPVGA